MIYRTFTLTDINFLSFKNFQFCCLYVFHKIRISTDTTPNANSLIMLCLLVKVFFEMCLLCCEHCTAAFYWEYICTCCSGIQAECTVHELLQLEFCKAHIFNFVYEIAIFISKHWMFNANNLEKIVRKWIFSKVRVFWKVIWEGKLLSV